MEGAVLVGARGGGYLGMKSVGGAVPWPKEDKM